MPAGRPSTYSDEVARKAREWLRNEENWKKDVIPMVESLALYLGVHKDTLYTWAKEVDEEGNLAKPEISDVLDQLKSVQHSKLIAGGLAGGYSPVITKLLLVSKHNYSDKSEQKVEHSGSISLVGLCDATEEE